MIIAGINELSFEPKMMVKMDSAGETETPEGMRPTQGPLVNLRYKPTTWRYHIKLSAIPTVGVARLELRAAGNVLKNIGLATNGVSEISGQTQITLSQTTGEAPLSVALVVDTPLDGAITATVDSVLSVEIPLTSSGGC